MNGWCGVGFGRMRHNKGSEWKRKFSEKAFACARRLQAPLEVIRMCDDEVFDKEQSASLEVEPFQTVKLVQMITKCNQLRVSINGRSSRVAHVNKTERWQSRQRRRRCARVKYSSQFTGSEAVAQICAERVPSKI